MGNELTASYRLVYFQPNPEDGERVCVALLFNTQRDVELLYDREFPKLRCLAPHIDRNLVEMYLEDMEAQLKHKPMDIDPLVRRHAPQLVASDVRRSVWPLSDTARIYLIKRFLSKEPPADVLSKARTHTKEPKDSQVKAHLRELVQRVGKERVADLQQDAKSQWVLGTSFHSHIDSVALALRKPNAVILIDGVDLTVLTPKRTIVRASKVTHTFWQYGRVQQIHVACRPLRIGIVLNGRVGSDADYRDAHDFALDQFRKEADLAIDGSSSADLERLEEKLRHA